jgi:hypothetical protein
VNSGDGKPRKRAYARNTELDALLGELDGFLRQLPCPFEPDIKHPIVLILGAPRSGTTLLSQWLASTGLFCFPTNFMSRFSSAPHLGALLQRMLFEPKFRFMGEFSDLPLASELPFSSDLGKTKETLAPHEFWYFWRRFFVFPDIPVSGEEFQKSAKFAEFAAACGAIQKVFGLPFFLKGLIANPYAAEFANAIPNLFLIHIKRETLSNAASILNSRREYFGNENEWWSFKPPEFEKLISQPPAAQAAGQVRFLNEAIERGIAKLDDCRFLQVDYASLCRSPQSIYERLTAKLAHFGVQKCDAYKGPQSFPISTGHGLSPGEHAAAMAVLS